MDIQEFFDPIQKTQQNLSYDDVDLLITMCDAVSEANNISVYIIDYAKQNFLYVSRHPLFLSGYTQEEVKEMGYHFYEKAVSPEDIQMLLEMNKMGWASFYNEPVEKRRLLRISYSFYLHHQKGGKTLIQHKLIPVRFTPDGNIWLAVCFVSNSPYKESGNVHLGDMDRRYFKYNFETHKLIPYTPEKLSERVIEILYLTMRGYEEPQIAEQLHITSHTVKSHRRKIIKKMGVNNLSNAVTMFFSKI